MGATSGRRHHRSGAQPIILRSRHAPVMYCNCVHPLSDCSQQPLRPVYSLLLTGLRRHGMSPSNRRPHRTPRGGQEPPAPPTAAARRDPSTMSHSQLPRLAATTRRCRLGSRDLSPLAALRWSGVEENMAARPMPESSSTPPALNVPALSCSTARQNAAAAFLEAHMMSGRPSSSCSTSRRRRAGARSPRSRSPAARIRMRLARRQLHDRAQSPLEVSCASCGPGVQKAGVADVMSLMRCGIHRTTTSGLHSRHQSPIRLLSMPVVFVQARRSTRADTQARRRRRGTARRTRRSGMGRRRSVTARLLPTSTVDQARRCACLVIHTCSVMPHAVLQV